jgi:hypothetical protein
MNAIADEAHVLLHCPCTDPVRLAFNGIAPPGSTLRALVSATRRDARTAFFVHDCIRAYTVAPVVATMPQYTTPLQQPNAHAFGGSDTNEHLDSESTTTDDLGSVPESEHDHADLSEDSDSDGSFQVAQLAEDAPLLLRVRRLRHVIFDEGELV